MSCSITGRFGFFSRGSRTPWSGFSFKSRRPSFVRSLVAQFSAVSRITRSDSIARSRTPLPVVTLGREPSPCRRARTNPLSGGETFLTSLALALELSAQVQSAAGALQLESIFIDEGFGTLDPMRWKQLRQRLRRYRLGAA